MEPKLLFNSFFINSELNNYVMSPLNNNTKCESFDTPTKCIVFVLYYNKV